MYSNQPMFIGRDVNTLVKTEDPKTLYSCSPGICRCPNGRLIATYGLRGPLQKIEDGSEINFSTGYIAVSDDHGDNWRQITSYPFRHARPFMAGETLYLLGHEKDLMVMRSDDYGDTWSEPVKLTEGEKWHQAPCNVWYANNCVYLVMEQLRYKMQLWPPNAMAPVLMRAPLDADLTKVESWTFAEAPAFRDVIDVDKLIYFGMPPLPVPDSLVFDPKTHINAPLGWLETNVVQVMDDKHWWHDPSGRTFHLFMRFHSGGTDFAAMLKVVEQGEEPGTGKMITSFQQHPSGADIVFLPMPGGHLKFHMLYDEKTKLYWLLSSQAREHFLAWDRNSLVLYYSKNLTAWCFAGVVALGAENRVSRSYASMVIDGDDLQILSRSGSENAKSAHDGDMVTFHRVENFRDLVY